MKITKSYLKNMIKEELTKNKIKESSEFSGISASNISDLLTARRGKMSVDLLIKQFPALQKLKNKTNDELMSIRQELITKEKFAKEKSSTKEPSYHDPNEPSLQQISKDFKEQEKEREALKIRLNKPEITQPITAFRKHRTSDEPLKSSDYSE